MHAEAFAKLTDEQRAVIYEELSKGAGTGERPLSSEPATLARAATRAEMRQPGTLERSFSNPAYRGPGFGSMIASSLIGTVAGYVIGSALVSAFLPWDGGAGASADSGSDSDATRRRQRCRRRRRLRRFRWRRLRRRRLRWRLRLLARQRYGRSSTLIARRSSIAA